MAQGSCPPDRDLSALARIVARIMARKRLAQEGEQQSERSELPCAMDAR
jgi:hypothetical protein